MTDTRCGTWRRSVEVLVLNSQQRAESPASLSPRFPAGAPRDGEEGRHTVDHTRGIPGTGCRASCRRLPPSASDYRPVHLYNLKRRAMTDYRYVSGKKVLAFSGLGDNGSFFGAPQGDRGGRGEDRGISRPLSIRRIGPDAHGVVRSTWRCW